MKETSPNCQPSKCNRNPGYDDGDFAHGQILLRRHLQRDRERPWQDTVDAIRPLHVLTRKHACKMGQGARHPTNQAASASFARNWAYERIDFSLSSRKPSNCSSSTRP